MADNGQGSGTDKGPGFAAGHLILDYIKAFLWPAVIVIAVLVYKDDVWKLLSEREVNIAGFLSLGPKVDDIETRAKAELADLRTLVQELQKGRGQTKITADIEAKLKSIERNLGQQIAQVRNVYQQSVPLTKQPGTYQVAQPQVSRAADMRATKAANAERRGFEALIRRDIGEALKAFDEAYLTWPEYHNVSEIREMLRKRQNRLKPSDVDEWAIVHRRILAQYSWGVPPDLRPAFRTEIKKAY